MQDENVGSQDLACCVLGPVTQIVRMKKINKKKALDSALTSRAGCEREKEVTGIQIGSLIPGTVWYES